MKHIAYCLVLGLFALSCAEYREARAPAPPALKQTLDWSERKADLSSRPGLTRRSTYLSVYPYIFHFSEEQTLNLTVTVSLRNTSSSDSVFVLDASYFSIGGALMKKYFDEPVFLKPLETVKIILNQSDPKGREGGSFVFDWAAPAGVSEPLFEAVMISTVGQQGLSFRTQGVRRGGAAD